MPKQISYKNTNGETQIEFIDFNEWFNLHNEICSKVLIVDRNVYNKHKTLIDKLKSPIFLYTASERNKSYSSILRILAFFHRNQVDRTTLIVAIGGGITCDIGSFAASIWKRGCKLMLVPTTLLAMVDAAIGGKTAINFKNVKNIIGTFYHPKYILIDKSFLKTLPNPIYIQGIPEIVKHAIISNKKLFNQLLKQANIFESYSDELIMQNIETKLKIVLEDPFENNQRKILNFGHTIGHALEMAYHLPHGNAVALGMLLETRTLMRMNYLKNNDIINNLQLLLNKIITSQKSQKLIFEELEPYILHDKKKQNDNLVLPLIEEIGRTKLINVNTNDFFTALKETLIHEIES